MPPNPFILSIASFELLISGSLKIVPVIKAMGIRCREKRIKTDD
jgi:hypothetical protein